MRDAVQGEVKIGAHEIDDLILLRADGTPTYMLAVAVDDHDMNVTHVIRGDDHLRNAFRQIPIFHAMDWPVPEFAHVPLIHGQDGKKLSKRHGATSTIDYKDLGYLAEGLKAYLLRLGWSHGDQEIFTQSEAEAVFDTSGMGKAPARLDLDKLNHINHHFMVQRDPAELMAMLTPFLEADSPLTPEQMTRITAALPHLLDRSDTLPSLAQACAFLRTSLPLSFNKNARKALKGEKLETLQAMAEFLNAWDDWSQTGTQAAIDGFLAQAEKPIGMVGPPLRAALTGGLPAPDLHLVLHWFGKVETQQRIQAALQSARSTA